MSAFVFQIISWAGFFISAVLFVVACILFFRLKIPYIIGELTGKTAQKQIRQIKEGNVTLPKRKKRHLRADDSFIQQSAAKQMAAAPIAPTAQQAQADTADTVVLPSQQFSSGSISKHDNVHQPLENTILLQAQVSRTAPVPDADNTAEGNPADVSFPQDTALLTAPSHPSAPFPLVDGAGNTSAVGATVPLQQVPAGANSPPPLSATAVLQPQGTTVNAPVASTSVLQPLPPCASSTGPHPSQTQVLAPSPFPESAKIAGTEVYPAPEAADISLAKTTLLGTPQDADEAFVITRKVTTKSSPSEP